MVISLESRRIVIAGASSLLGAELKSLLEESRFAACDFRLVDEESFAGRLTAAGGEPAVIQSAEPGSFNKASIIFFTGSSAFTRANFALAAASGAQVIDLSGALTGDDGNQTWLSAPAQTELLADARSFSIPSAFAEIICRLSTAMDSLHASGGSAVAFLPVSVGGAAGIEELESQTGQLLSFQPPGKAVFDAQVAFNMLDRFGAESSHSMQTSLETLRKEIRACLPAGAHPPAVQLLHAPVFYGATVSMSAILKSASDAERIASACTSVGFRITTDDTAPSNVGAAGESALLLAAPRQDTAASGVWWFWAAADNLRRPASNGVKLAEKLFA